MLYAVLFSDRLSDDAGRAVPFVAAARLGEGKAVDFAFPSPGLGQSRCYGNGTVRVVQKAPLGVRTITW